MNEVSAVLRRLAMAMLTADDFVTIGTKWPEIAECFQVKKAYEVARGRLEMGEGIGCGKKASAEQISRFGKKFGE